MTTAENVLSEIQQKFPATLLKAQQPRTDRLYLTVKREEIRPLTDYLFNTLHARLILSVGTDKTPIDGNYEVSYIYSLDSRNLILLVKELVPPNDPQVPSVTNII
ncbi:MAG: hypothetical protein WBQ19_21910, partial [Terriglobales bacterium]